MIAGIASLWYCAKERDSHVRSTYPLLRRASKAGARSAVVGYVPCETGAGATLKEVPRGGFLGSATELPRLQRVIHLDRWRTKLLPGKGLTECTGPLSDLSIGTEVADGRPAEGPACGDLRRVWKRNNGAVHPTEWATGLLQSVLWAGSRGGHLSQHWFASH